MTTEMDKAVTDLERVIIEGDLSKLTPEQRARARSEHVRGVGPRSALRPRSKTSG